MIVNDDSTSITNKLETSLIDNARVVIYDRYMFIVLATSLTFLSKVAASNRLSRHSQRFDIRIGQKTL
jgi:hypothetical protein